MCIREYLGIDIDTYIHNILESAPLGATPSNYGIFWTIKPINLITDMSGLKYDNWISCYKTEHISKTLIKPSNDELNDIRVKKLANVLIDRLVREPYLINPKLRDLNLYCLARMILKLLGADSRLLSPLTLYLGSLMTAKAVKTADRHSIIASIPIISDSQQRLMDIIDQF